MCGHANSCDRIRCSKSDSIQLPSCLLHELPSTLFPCCSTSFTTAGYGSHQNVFIRLDPLGRPPSATGSYATIASLNKYPTETKKSCSIFDRKSANYLSPFRFNPIGYKLLNVLSLPPHRLPQLTDADAVCHSTAAHGRPGRGDHLLQARIGLSLENIVLCLVAANPGKSRLRTSLTDFDGTPGGKVWAQTG